MPRKRKRRRVFFGNFTFFHAGLLAGLIFSLAAGVFISSLVKDLPDPASFDTLVIKQSTKIYDRTGKVLLYEIHGREKRTIIPFAGIPATVKAATLAAEDINFYNHPAYDLKAIVRAILYNVFLSRDGSLQGGSTITQQLVKNSFLSPEKTFERKVRELILAIRFERQYSKDEILGFYLNQIPYGANAYGIESASQTFFAKPAKDLILAEAALLAALPKAPTYYLNNDLELKKRQEYILDRMANFGFISQEDAKNAKAKKLIFATKGINIRAPHFVFFVREILEEKFGKETVENGGLKVITSLDWRAQEVAEKAVKEGAAANDTNWQAGNAALVAEDPRTGEIIALVGGRGGFSDDPKPAGCEPGLNCKFEPFVNATVRSRQPGSAFKPFVYATAFQKGYTPETIVFDLPTEFVPNHPACPAIVNFSNEHPSCYHPQNYDDKFRGPVTFRQALAQSLNVPSVKVLYLAGVADSIGTSNKLGITTLNDPPEHYGLSLVLGGGGVKLIELVHAYGAFSQDGILKNQTAILRVEDSGGNVLDQARQEEKVVLEPQIAGLINNILSDDNARVPAFQPGGLLTLPERRVAAKTGTSQDFRDAWVIGYTPSLVAGVWVGNNDYSPMIKGGAGVMAAAPIWNAFMKEYLGDLPAEDFNPPEPIPASKPVLRGEYIVNTPAGPQIHDLLFWVEKNNPQGPHPQNPQNDPQFANWEAGVSEWVKNNFPDLQHLNQSRILPSQIKITLIEPDPNAKISSEGLRITVRATSSKPLVEVAFFFNKKMVITFDPSPNNLYSAYFIPPAWEQENEIVIIGRDESGNTAKESFPVLR